MHRKSPRSAPRLARTLACAAVALPVLLVAGCSSDSDSGEESASPSASKSEAPSAAPAKYKELPDACKTLSKDTVKELTPKTDNEAGKRIGTGDTSDSGSCLWSGLDKYDYRQLTVSMKRFDSDTARGTGNKLAEGHMQQQIDEVKENKDNKGVKSANVDGVGDAATSLTYELKKKDDKGKSEEFREERLVARTANVVVVVDYEGAGFEDGKTPSADDLKKKAEKAAKEVIKSIK
ncbi:DUF3558 domain-containing protein [Streptomyces daliensis]|uniref:DUF3558 domain-containing protein n=1 Tax=Streptomyces daliensis TaxID=299421 RepID=A0A8T4IQN2_9ACTN|nr:DUF3558 domain-containing protein [Streptomyces daliensis]